MNDEQLIIFGNHIRNNTDPTVVAALQAGNNNDIAAWYNNDANPDHWVFKNSISVDEAVEDGIQWDSDYSSFKQEVSAIDFLFRNGTYRVQKPNARDALNEVFQGANSTKQAFLILATRLASEFEKIFSDTPSNVYGGTDDGPGGGDGSLQNSAAIAVVTGPCSHYNVRDALNLTAE